MSLRSTVLRLLPIVAVLGVLAFPASAGAADNPPTLSITSPSAGTILSGNVTVTVNAQDDVGVDHVIYRFFDGTNMTTLGTSSTPPFDFTFDSRTLPNCGPLSCTLYAQAVDTASQTSGGSFGVGNSVGVHNAIVVDTTADNTSTTGTGCSLRQAIASANDNTAYAGCKSGLSSPQDSIQIPAGAYNLTAGQLNVTSDIDIVGAGAHSTDIRGYALGQRVLEVSSGNLLVARATIEGGNTVLNGPEDNAGHGGGIYVKSGATLHTQNLIVSLNHADTSGGGIQADGALFVSTSTIENNTAGAGGGIDDFGPIFGLDDSTIAGNRAQTDGGGLLLGGSANTLINDTIANNLAGLSGSGSGGGIAGTSNSINLTNTLLAQNGTTLANSDCSVGITSNGHNLDDDATCGLTSTGDQQGVDPLLGPLDTSGSTDVLPLTKGSPAIDAANGIACPAVDQVGTSRPQGSGCDIGAVEYVPPPSDYFVSTPQELQAALANASAGGVPATIHIAAGQYDLGNTTGTASVDPQDGGPITLQGAGAASTILDGDNVALNVVDVSNGTETSTIEGLTVQNGTNDGIDDNGRLVLKDSLVQNNAFNGVESTNGGLQVSGSTISGNGDPNVSFENNGGIYVESTFSAVNTTITGNNGHGISVDYVDQGASLNDVTIAGNQGEGISFLAAVSITNTIIANNAGGDCTSAQGFSLSNGHNLDSDSSCFFTAQGDLQGKDPQLGPLHHNGGPTPTMALAPGSPAVDAGDDGTCSAVDQRGTPRPQGSHCDIGAFELVLGTIAFESNRTGSSQIFAMSPDGSNVVQLTHDPSTTTDTLPSISPDGHTIVYQSTDNTTGSSQIWEMNGDGSNQHPLTSVGSNLQPTFSPNGSKIAFDSNRNGQYQLFVMNADGSGQTQVMTTGGAVGGSSWSPDGSQIAFNEDTNGTNQIFTVNVGTGTVTGPLTSTGANTNPHWSPDGSKMLFVSSRCTSEAPFCGGGESVFVMNADGTNQHNLTDAPIFDADPAWSPDGSHIAFVRDLGGQNFNVFTANADGTNQVQLTFGSAPSRNSFPNWGAQVNAGVGSLSGSLSTAGQQNADLTAAGTQDWAIWGNANNGLSTSLAPDVRKAGGSGISNLTDVHANAAPLRGLGQFFLFGGSLFGNNPFSFNWSDGTSPLSSATGAFGGLQHDGQSGLVGANGDGFSFTVPADTTQRILAIYTTAHFATGTLTATLSDGSAPSYTQDLTGSTGFPLFGGNGPGVFTIDYSAASPGQHLTVNWVETAGGDPFFGSDNAAIYAVALAGTGSSSVTSATASLGSDSSVAISGSVPTSHISLSAFEPQPLGALPLSINGLQLANTQLANTQLANTQLANTQLANTQLANTQLAHTQLANTQLANTQLAHTQLANTQLANTQLANTQLANTQLANTQLAHTQLANTGLPLNTVPLNTTLYPDGWAGLLRGTRLDGQPLQTIALHDVLSLSSNSTDVPNPPAGKTAQQVIQQIQSLSFAELDLPSSTLGQVTVGALALGGATVNQLGDPLQSDIESQLLAWCLSFVASTGAPSGFCAGSNPGIGYLSLIQLSLLGAPVQSLQLANTQLANTQLANTQLANTQLANTQLANTQLANTPLSTSASGIVGMQLANTDLTPLYSLGGLFVHDLPTDVQNALFDCSSFNCATGTLAQAQAAGAIRPTTTLGDLDRGGFLDRVTIAQLLATVLGPQSAYRPFVNFGDLVGLFLRNSDVPWESLSPDVLAIFDPSRPSMSMTANFTVQGTGTPAADVKVDLPAGFDYKPGSASLTKNEGAEPAPGDPTITRTAGGSALHWHFDSVDPDAFYVLRFSVYGGTTVGPNQAAETVTAGGQSDSSIRPFSVTDSFPNAGTAANAASVDTTPGHDSVEMSTLPTAGTVDYYTFPMPAAGTRIQVHLTNLPADYDLALYSPRTTSVRTGATPASPLQDGVVPDTQVDLNGGSSGQLTPTGLADRPNPGIPLVQLSDNRHIDDEDVGMVSPGGGGSITVAVFGYNGAFSPQAYTLRVKETAAPTTQICSARTFDHSGAGTTPDSLPSLSSLPANLNTIILVDEKRLGDTYGATDEATAIGKLHSLAGDTSLGVSGVVVPVETIPGVQHLYDLWDANPCDPGAANAVANAIADEVNAIAAARPSVQNLVFAGGDDQIPFFRLPDLSLIANESGFAGQFAPNEYRASLAAGDLLSDDPYLDTHPVPASGQQLFPPNLAGGRLVETAQDIAGAVNAFEHAPTPGALKSSTAFVSGYDFVADGAQRVAANLARSLGTANVRTLGSPTSLFSLTNLLGAAFPLAGPAAINSWNGHFDNYRAQMANGDILSTTNPLLPGSLNNGIFFTMGCHAGFQTTDAVVGSTVLDWPQYFSRHNTGFVGNTGYGLGDTDSVAFSEELMADLAGHLGGSSTLGQALLQAKQQYYLSRAAFSNYDEKALSEAELYGLPMYGVGQAPRALAASTPSPDPVSGTTGSTSPSQGSLSPFTTGVQSASFSATPRFSLLQHGANGDYFTNDGQLQAPNYRPLQPYVSLPAARGGLTAHGVVIDGLTSSDTTGFTPDNVRPTLNSSATEPPPTFTDEAWPERIPTLVSLGDQQSLNLITGQFFTETGGSTTTGVERRWTQIGGRVTYSNSQDFTPPTIDSIDAFLSNGIVAFTGRFSDLDQNGGSGTVRFAEVVYDNGGQWSALPLQYDSTSQSWSGGAPFSGADVQYFVEACDTAGNCGYSSNKGRYFDAQPLPPPTSGSLTITASRQPDTGGTWYINGLAVSATSTAPGASISVDGGTFGPGPVNISGDGAHVVEASDSDGNTATAVYLIDTTGPAITHALSPAQPNGTNGWYVTKPTLSFACTDNVSGVRSCLIDGGGSSSKTLDEGSNQGASATGIDNAGNSSHATASAIKVDVTAPTAPTFTGITGGLIYPVNSVPAQNTIMCTATDATSGLQGCAFTGYSNAVGSHTLTATATDKAGNTSTSTLTYTVGFMAGNILAPVTAKNNDQTNPLATDLQVFKIKSTVPLKFQFYLDAAKTQLMTSPPVGSIALLTVAKHDATTDSIDQTLLVTAPADSGNQFRWTGASDYQYIFNMATSKLAAGTYYCQITLYAANGTTVLGLSVRHYFVLRS
jgi:CSLREA domain-containing protein